MTFVYLQRNIVDNNKAHSDIRTANGFVITTEPLGFVMTKEVNVFLLRVLVYGFESITPIGII